MNKKYKRSLALLLALCMVLLSLTACGGKSTDTTDKDTSGTETIKIGNTQPMSGPSAAAGTNAKDAVELAVEIINGSYPDIDLPFAATEGIPSKNGAKLEVIWGDNKAEPQTAMSETERIINEGVVLMTGGNFSGVTAASSEVAERKGLPYLNDCASSPALNKRDYKWYFSITPDDQDFAAMFFDFFADMKSQGKKIDNIALCYMNAAFGMDGSSAIRGIAEEQKYGLVADLMYDVKTTNLTGEVQKLKAANPDVLVPISNVTDAVLLTKTMKDMNYVPQAILAQNAGFTERDYAKMLGKDAEFIMTRDLFSPELGKNNPTIKKIADMFYEKYGYQMNGQSARAFQGTFVIADVLDRAKSLESEDIRAAFEETDLTADDLFMPWEGIKFNDTGKNTLGRGFIVQIQDGNYVPIWPADIATGTMVWPFPAWDQRK